MVEAGGILLGFYRKTQKDAERSRKNMPDLLEDPYEADRKQKEMQKKYFEKFFSIGKRRKGFRHFNALTR